MEYVFILVVLSIILLLYTLRKYHERPGACVIVNSVLQYQKLVLFAQVTPRLKLSTRNRKMHHELRYD